MKRNQFFMLLVAGVIVGGIALSLYRHSGSSWNSASSSGVGKKLLPDLAINDVSQIQIRRDAELNLIRTNDQWVVKERGDYPANFSLISDLVRKLADLKVIQTVEVGPSQRGRLELLEPGKGANSGTQVELKGAGNKTIKSLLLGKKHMRSGGGGGEEEGGFPDGRYVLVGSGDNVAVVADPLADVEPKPENWLNKDLFKIERVKSVSLVSTNATNSWKITRESETNDWILADAKPDEKLDTGKVAAFANALSSPTLTDVAVNDTNAVASLAHATGLTFETFDNLVYKLEAGSRPGGESYYLKVALSGEPVRTRVPGKDEKPDEKTKLDKEWSDKLQKSDEKIKQEKALEKWTFVVAKWTLDPVLKDRSQLMVEKKEDKPAAGADSNPVSPTVPNFPTLPGQPPQ